MTILGIKSFFWENKTTKQTIFKNTFWLGISGGISQFLRFILLIYVAKILGATEYGKFTFALAFVTLFIIFAQFGLSIITTRELAREKEKEKEFSAILSLKILLSLGTFLLIFIGSFFITSEPVVQKLIWILAICSLAGSFSSIIHAFLQARQKMEYQSLASIFEALILTGAGLFILFNFPSVENLSYVYLFASLIALIFLLVFFHFKIQQLSLSWNKSTWKRLLLMSWPLAMVGVLSTIYTQIDSIMMGYLGQITQTGWYNAAYRITWLTMIPIGLISTSFFPVLSKTLKESKEKLQKIWNNYIEIMILLAIPVVVGGIVLAPKIVEFIYGSSYNPSVLAFQILIVMTGIIFLCSPFNQVLIVSDQQKKLFWSVLLGAIINIILNLILIPKFSLYGAAFATVITHLLVFYLLFKFTLKFTAIKPFTSRFLLIFTGIIFSSAVMYFVIIQPQIYHLHILLSILIGAAVYFGTFFVLKFMLKYFYTPLRH
ncbi:MAG: flippase [bacterium]